MSFNTALSGLNAAQSDLNVTSNNIANVNTTGFKHSRAEFGDIYANSTFGNSKTAIGSGVLIQAVSQQFKQGNLDFTQNSLDFALSGEGFFVLSPEQGSGERIYSRAGAFGVDRAGFVSNSAGQQLQVFPVNDDGSVKATALSSTIPLQLPQSAGTPTATKTIEIAVNLPADAGGLSVQAFRDQIPAPVADANGDFPLPIQEEFVPSPDSYNSSTSLNVFDSLGERHIATVYYVKSDDLATEKNTWYLFMSVDGKAVPFVDENGAQTDAKIVFREDGSINTDTSNLTALTRPLNFGNGSDDTQQVTFKSDRDATTQFASPFTVGKLTQDGFAVGRLTGLDVSDTGVVRASYSNGQSTALGKIALARFPNSQGLSQLGNNTWGVSTLSGDPLAGEAGTASFGLVRAGALESSNVELTKELVKLITAQRNFQANAKAIETNNAVTQNLLNIR